MAWTDERVELLKKLWGEGQSASQIAKELGGVTRNAVIGKVHRLGLSNRVDNSSTSRAKKADAKPKATRTKEEAEATKPSAEVKPSVPLKPHSSQPPARKQIVPATQVLPPQPAINEVSEEALASHREVQKRALRLSVMELTEKTCKWPFGDPATDDFWFCGLPVEPGKPYCKPCVEIAYQPMSSRRDRRR